MAWSNAFSVDASVDTIAGLAWISVNPTGLITPIPAAGNRIAKGTMQVARASGGSLGVEMGPAKTFG